MGEWRAPRGTVSGPAAIAFLCNNWKAASASAALSSDSAAALATRSVSAPRRSEKRCGRGEWGAACGTLSAAAFSRAAFALAITAAAALSCPGVSVRVKWPGDV